MPPESYIEGNPSSSTVLCTFWSLAKPIAEKLPSEKFAVCSNLYSHDGINTVVRAIYQHPHWRHLILFGADLTHSGDVIRSFFEQGIDDKGKVAGTSFTFQSEIPIADLQTFRTQVTLHDFRGKTTEEVVKKMGELPILPSFAAPKTFPAPKPPEFSLFHSEKQGFMIRGPTISHAWLSVLDYIMKFGEEKPTEYGNRQKEILNLFCVIEGDDENIPEFLPFTERDFEEYKGKILTAEKPENVAYTYGSRLHEWPGSAPINQVEHAIAYLKKTPHTRRAVAVTWHVEKDINDKNPPCLTEVIWSVSHGKLQQTCLVRSHDMFEGWPLNLFGWRELQKKVSVETGIPLGSLMVLSTSAHIYDTKWDEAKKILAKYYAPSSYRFDQDPRGNFVISIVPGKEPNQKTVSVQHFTFDGQKTKFIFHPSQTANEKIMLEELFSHLAHSNLVSRTDHAFYLGAELHKALTAIRLGKEYMQDRELPP